MTKQKKPQTTEVIRLLNAAALGRKLLATTAMTMAGMLAMTSSAFAVGLDETPTGGEVVAGSSAITYGAGTMTVDQTTQNSVINWNSFNIGQNASATYNQPNAQALSVNRITGGGAAPSQILGSLSANGRIMILDPNGVFFSKTAVVDVNSLIASTGTLDSTNQARLMAGQPFDLTDIGQNPNAKVENAGALNAAESGLVAFVAPWAANAGFINVKLGQVTLAAGNRVTVDLAGDNLIALAVGDTLQQALVENSGTIDAQGGKVVMAASAAKGIVDDVVNMSGVIQASSFSQKGGTIVLSGGDAGKVKVSGKLQANGGTDGNGGKVAITGDVVEITPDAYISADGGTDGNGGDIGIFAKDTTLFEGVISARGGSASGDGGTVEVSSEGDLLFNGSVTTQASNGLSGTLLIDPSVYTIHSGSLNAVNFMAAQTLANLMENNGFVTVQASQTLNVGSNTSGGGVGNEEVDVSTYDYNTEEQVLTGSHQEENGGSWQKVKGWYQWHGIWLYGWHNKFITTYVTVNDYTTVTTNHTGTTDGSLKLWAPTVNFIKDLIMGNGDVLVKATTLNLNSQIYNRDWGVTGNHQEENGGSWQTVKGWYQWHSIWLYGWHNEFITTYVTVNDYGWIKTLLGDSRLNSTGNLQTINVQSSNALIQQAISFANNGVDINVAAGTYDESVKADKSVGLFGTNAVITPHSPGFNVTADDVTIDGFEIVGAEDGVRVTNASGVTINNNWFHDLLSGDGVKGSNADDLTVFGNTFNMGNDDDGVEVDGNSRNLTVSANTFTGGNDGVIMSGSGTATIVNNFFSGIGDDGVQIDDSGSAYSSITVFNNSFTGFNTSGHDAINNNDSRTVNASGNWWGTTSENTVAGMMGGSVDFTPFLMGGTDTSGDKGFQGDFSNLFVTNKGSQTQSGGRINEAIGSLANGSLTGGNRLIWVGAGNFGENVMVDKSVTLRGNNWGNNGNGVRNNESTVYDLIGFGGEAYGFKVTASHVTIDGFNVYTDGNGVRLEGGHGYKIINNIIDTLHVVDSHDEGIKGNNASSVLVKDNKITTSDNDAVEFDGGWFITILDNLIDTTASGFDGVNFNGVGNGWISGNTIRNIGDDAVSVSNGNGWTKILGNKIYNVNDIGVRVSDTSWLTVDGNAIYDTGNDAVQVSDSFGAKITDNWIGAGFGGSWQGSNNVGGEGVDLNNSAGSLINGNYITQTQSNGISTNPSPGSVISDNIIKYVDGHGILLNNGNNYSKVTGNIIYQTGGNGIRTEGSSHLWLAHNKVGESGNDGFSINGGHAITLYDNNVSGSHGDGMQIKNAHDVLVKKNHIDDSRDDGLDIGNSSDIRVTENKIHRSGANGAEVTNSCDVSLDKNEIKLSGQSGVYAADTHDLDVTRNFISGGLGNGVTLFNAPHALVAGNSISGFENGVSAFFSRGVNILYNHISHVWNDGVQGYFTNGIRVVGNLIHSYGDDGVQIAYSHGLGFFKPVLIAGNTIIGNLPTPAPEGEEGGEGDEQVFAKSIYGHGGNTGIRLGDNEGLFGGEREEEGGENRREFYNPVSGDFSGVQGALIINNDILNNDVGLDARAFNNGYINVNSNRFIDNQIGMWIGSGLIDLRGTRNTIIDEDSGDVIPVGNIFHGGDTAMIFERGEKTYYPGYQQQILADCFAECGDGDAPFTSFAFLRLAGDTLGTTVFEEQTNYYVDLRNGAFFDPGAPTIIDGTQALWDGVWGGQMSAAQLQAIEAKLNDFDDDTSLGQIFAGWFLSLDDNQILKKILNYRYGPGRASIVVKGLPLTGDGPSIFNLANIEPAAGGDDGSNGGEEEPPVNGHCWGALGGGGGAFEIGLDSNLTNLLADLEACKI